MPTLPDPVADTVVLADIGSVVWSAEADVLAGRDANEPVNSLAPSKSVHCKRSLDRTSWYNVAYLCAINTSHNLKNTGMGPPGPIHMYPQPWEVLLPLHLRPGDLPWNIPPPVGLGLPHHQVDNGPLNQSHFLVANGQPQDPLSGHHGQTEWRWMTRAASQAKTDGS